MHYLVVRVPWAWYGSDMIKPWVKQDEEEIRVGFRRLVKRNLKLPDGRVEEYTLKKEGPAVCVLALTADKKVILAKQYRPGPDAVLLELPGGEVNEDEGAEKSIERELLEETGYKGELHFVGTSLDDAYSTMVRHNFVALHCRKIQDQRLDANEFIEVVEMPLAQFRQEIQKGQFTDLETAYLGLDYLNKLAI